MCLVKNSTDDIHFAHTQPQVGDKLGTNTCFCILTLRKTWLRKRVAKCLEPRSVQHTTLGRGVCCAWGAAAETVGGGPAPAPGGRALSCARKAGTGQVLSKRCAVRTCHLAARCYQLCPVGRLRASPGHRWESWGIGQVFWLGQGLPRTEH